MQQHAPRPTPELLLRLTLLPPPELSKLGAHRELVPWLAALPALPLGPRAPAPLLRSHLAHAPPTSAGAGSLPPPAGAG
jgi:hypothetical protein